MRICLVLSSEVFDRFLSSKMVKIQMDQNGQAGENGHSLKVTRLESARRFCDMMEEEEDISLAQVHQCDKCSEYIFSNEINQRFSFPPLFSEDEILVIVANLKTNIDILNKIFSPLRLAENWLLGSNQHPMKN